MEAKGVGPFFTIGSFELGGRGGDELMIEQLELQMKSLLLIYQKWWFKYVLPHLVAKATMKNEKHITLQLRIVTVSFSTMTSFS